MNVKESIKYLRDAGFTVGKSRKKNIYNETYKGKPYTVAGNLSFELDGCTHQAPLCIWGEPVSGDSLVTLAYIHMQTDNFYWMAAKKKEASK